MSNFTKYTERNKSTDRTPQLYVRPGQSQAYINVGAVEQFFTPHGSLVDRATFYTDREHSTLAINPGEDGPESFSIHEKAGGSGGNISIQGVLLKAFDVDIDALDERWDLDLERDADSGLVVADVSGLVEATTDVVHCPECGKRCASEQGLKQHVSIAHDDTITKSDLAEMSPEDLGLSPVGERPEGGGKA